MCSSKERTWIELGYPTKESRVGLCLHHVDTSLKEKDPARYRKWLKKDVVPMTINAHARLHALLRVADGWEGYWKDKKLSEEHKRKIAEAHIGVPRDEETKRKISNTMKGHVISDETKAKMRDAKLGRRWWNNGEIEVMQTDKPAGFTTGRLKKNRAV